MGYGKRDHTLKCPVVDRKKSSPDRVRVVCCSGKYPDLIELSAETVTSKKRQSPLKKEGDSV